jgi:hypothetical protein
MPSPFILGKDCKAYYSATPLTSTTYATPLSASIEITDIRDLDLNLSTDTTDISVRGGGGWKQSAVTLKDATISFNMKWLPADTAFSAILTAWLNNVEIAFFALDGVKTAASGSQGPAGNWMVKSFKRNEKLTEAVSVDVELVPSSFNGWVVA